MTHADAVFGEGFLAELSDQVAAGYIRTQVHPTEPYTIYNYTEKATFDREWNRATLNCRGLILNYAGEVVARPFKKFFNYGEPCSIVVPIDDLVLPIDKIDGSLGIMYWTSTGPAIATRGSFTSDQALHATGVLHEKYAEWAQYVKGKFPHETFLFEIIYPENRIVVDYEGQDDLVLLGSVHNQYGHYCTPDVCLFEGPKAEHFGVMSFRDALALPPRPGKEGLVLYHYASNDRVKVKQEDYVRLHKIVTNLNERAVWEILKTPEKDTWAWIAELPDEFHDWAKQVADDLRGKYRMIEEQIKDEYAAVTTLALNDPELHLSSMRKVFASYAKTSGYAWALFAELDGKDYSEKIWQLIRPEAHQTPHGKKAEDE